MARRSRMSIQKRQREIRKAEKAARKRAKRHGHTFEPPAEPTPSVGAAELFGPTSDEDAEEGPREEGMRPEEDQDQ